MRKLKIGILGTRGIPNHYGGFEQFAEYLSAGLLQRGHHVSVYNSSLHPYKEKEWKGVEIIHCSDLEHRIGTAGQFFYDLNCINDARKRNFDILLHLGYTSDSIWHRRWPKNTINMMNMDGLEWKRSKYNKLTQQFLKWAESLAAKNAEVLIADSHRMQEYLWNKYAKKAVYIPYGAEVFTEGHPEAITKYDLLPYKYSLLIARMEPENNIEMIIQGYLDSKRPYPLLIVGNTGNKFGKYLSSNYSDPSIRFFGPIYERPELDNLRYFSARYFHGHSVGGTNPSLLEAMACGCNIATHDNAFNTSILLKDADYFANASDIAALINRDQDTGLIDERRLNNVEKIRTIYSMDKNIDDYEQLMLHACGEAKRIMRVPVMETA